MNQDQTEQPIRHNFGLRSESNNTSAAQSPASVSAEKSIEEVLLRYATAIDERDYKLFDDIFVVNATAQYGFFGHIDGRAALSALLKGAMERCGPSQHMLGNYRIVVNGKQASSKCYLQAILVGLDDCKDKHMLLWGEYRDRLELRPEGWRIVHRELVIIYATGDIGLGAEKKGA